MLGSGQATMELEGRGVRRFGYGAERSVLPLRTSSRTRNRPLHNTISCWYCDYKISAFNAPLFRFGRRHATCLRLWFSIGVGFSLAALLGVTMILVWELSCTLHIFHAKTTNLTRFFFPWPQDYYLSLADAAYIFLSTVVSVSVHEFGHAVAAASEGIQMEYVAIFTALVFPGALVAFNYESLQALHGFTVLRVYCAGIWHNAVCCAVCGLALFLLPFILSPFYIYGESPMVLDVPSISPLFGYLFPGNVIVSLDGKRIHSEQEWMETISLIKKQSLENLNHSKDSEAFGTVHSRKGYCVSSSMIEESNKVYLVDYQSTCPNGVTEFIGIPCFDLSKLDDANIENGAANRRDSRHCLDANDVVKLNKCGDGWMTETSNESNCLCSLDESCLSPVQLPGLVWTEITYSSPYDTECSQLGRYYFANSKPSGFMGHDCGGTLVFVGDIISMAQSVSLTAYQPRWAFAFNAYLPSVLEKGLMCTFHVSLTLALVNSLPVYFLDGESILEAALCHFTLLGPRNKAKVLQACLLVGTLISTLVFMTIFINFL